MSVKAEVRRQEAERSRLAELYPRAHATRELILAAFSYMMPDHVREQLAIDVSYLAPAIRLVDVTEQFQRDHVQMIVDTLSQKDLKSLLEDLA